MFEATQIEKIVLLIFTFIFIMIISGVIRYYLNKILKNSLSKHSIKLVTTIIQYALIIIILYYINTIYFKFELGVFMTSLGIISIAVAYSSQQIIQNFISGLFISFGRHISIGDWVEVAPPSVIGKVKDISSMRITLRDVSGKIHFIPNSLLMTTRVINYSKSGFVEMQVPLTICSSANFESVEKVILDVLSKNSRVLPNVSKSERVKVFKIFKLEYVKEIYPEKDLVLFVPQVMVSGIASDKINLNINFWIREIEKRDEIVSEILLGIREGLGKGKILI